MAIQRVIFNSVPLASKLLLEYPHDKTAYKFSAAVFYEDGNVSGQIVKQPCVIYHHGSSATGYPDVTDPLMTALVNAGFNVIAFRNFGSGDSSQKVTNSVQTTGNSPWGCWHYYANYGAWSVQASLEFWQSVKNTYFTDAQVGLFGHSQGANYILGWANLCDTSGFYSNTVVRCAFINGLTPPGTGAKQSRSIMRQATNIDMYLHGAKIPIVAAFGNEETFAMADLNKRWLYSNRGNPLVTFFAPNRTGAAAGHNWIFYDGQNTATAVAQFTNKYATTPPKVPIVPLTDELLYTIPDGFTFSRASPVTVTQADDVVTIPSNTPAFAYNFDSLAASGIQISSRRQNIVPNSSNMSGLFGSLVSVPSERDPFGVLGVSKIVESTLTEIHGRTFSLSLPNNSVTRVISLYVKAAERYAGYLELADGPANPGFSRVYFDLYAGTVYDAESGTGVTNSLGMIEPVGDGWYRISRRANLNTSNTTLRFRIRMLDEPVRKLSYAGDGVSGLYIFGPQVEVCPDLGKHSAYIPTTGATVTRQEDTLQVPSRTRTTGTFVVKFFNSPGTAAAGANPRVILGSGVADLYLDGATATKPVCLAIAYGPDNIRVSRNGGSVTVSAPIAFPSQLYLGGGLSSGDRADLDFLYFAEYDSVLSDEVLRALSVY